MVYLGVMLFARHKMDKNLIPPSLTWLCFPNADSTESVERAPAPLKHNKCGRYHTTSTETACIISLDTIVGSYISTSILMILWNKITDPMIITTFPCMWWSMAKGVTSL